MANRVDLESLVHRLITYTDLDRCDWKDNGNSSYRLLLSGGSVIFQSIFNLDTNDYYFKIDLFDLKDRFATYYAYNTADDSYFSLLSNLRDSILNYMKRIMEEKMGMLYESIG